MAARPLLWPPGSPRVQHARLHRGRSRLVEGFMVQRVSGVTILLCGVATMAGGCGDSEPGHPGTGGPGACDAAWHDFQHGTELDDQLWGLAIDAVNNVYLTGYEHG